MTLFHLGEQLLAGPSSVGASFPDGSIYESRDPSADSTYDRYESPPPIGRTRVDDLPNDHHSPWASTSPGAESLGCLPGSPEVESGSRASPHLSGNSEDRQSDCSSVSSVHYSNGNGALLRSYNWQHQHVNAITCTPPIPPHLPTHSDRFASGSTQSTNLRVPRISIPRMTLDGVIELCPGCYASPFPSVWTMDGLGCVHCELWLAHPKVAQSGSLPSPVPPPPPAMPLDQPRALNNCSFQNNSRKGKLPQSRARRSAKASSPTVQESRCCPFTSSGNITLPCLHINCSPPPDIRYLSRHGMENDKWERARKEAVASFSYENCGFYKLPIEVVWMIVDLYPRLDYSYMRSIRAEPSVYNHRFEVLRNLIGVSKSFRRTFYNTYWETFEIALTYPNKRAPEPGQLDLGTESSRSLHRLKELQGLRKTFWNMKDTAACIRTLTFRVDRDSEIMQLFVDCLLALPNLHTLEIAPTSLPLVTLFGNAFKNRPQYRSVRKLIAPAGAHPILQSLPNLEELVCTRGEKPHILLTRVFQAYDSLNTKALFKRFELIGSNWTDMVGKELLRCFPNIQKVAMRKPSVTHLEKLALLTEISELDLWVLDNTEAALIKRLKMKGIEILRNSKPRTVCECDVTMDVDPEFPAERAPGMRSEYEETKPVGCRCKPPKRVFRLKHLVRKHGQWGTPFWGSERVEEIEVSPLED